MLTMLSKFAALPFYPVGMTVILIAAGLLSFRYRREAAGRALMVCAGVVLFLFSTDPLSYGLVRSLEFAGEEYRFHFYKRIGDLCLFVAGVVVLNSFSRVIAH